MSVHRFARHELIGRGISSTVYRGVDTHNQRPVAIKVLNPFLKGDPILIERFRRELQIAREIQDPHIISIFDFIDTDTEKFLVMELLEGQDLKSYILSYHPLPIDFILNYIKTVLEAVLHCHQRGIIHRDLKPQNLFVLNDQSPKVIDFGISRMASQTEITVAGTAIGSPEYMAPELFHVPLFDYRTDIYALGIILFEMITGQLPFQGDSITALYQEHLNKPLPSIKQLRTETPDWLIAIIEKMTSKNNVQRYQGIEEILFDLKEKNILIKDLKVLRKKYCLHCGEHNAVPLSHCLHCGKSFGFEGEAKERFQLMAPDYSQKGLKAFFENLCQRQLPRLGARRKSFIIAKKLTSQMAANIIDQARSKGITINLHRNNLASFFKLHRTEVAGMAVFFGFWALALTENSFLGFIIRDSRFFDAVNTDLAMVYYFAPFFGIFLSLWGTWSLFYFFYYMLDLKRPWLKQSHLFPVNLTLSQLEWLTPYIQKISAETNNNLKSQFIQLIEHYVYITNHPAFTSESLRGELQQQIIIAAEFLVFARSHHNNAEIQESINNALNELNLRFNLYIGKNLIVNQPVQAQEIINYTNGYRSRVQSALLFGKVS